MAECAKPRTVSPNTRIACNSSKLRCVCAENERIYALYCELLQHTHAKFGGATSHEYVVRVIAQKYDLSFERVAGIVQLQHNQEQIVQNGGTLCDDVAAYILSLRK